MSMEEEKDTSWEEEFDKRFSYLYQHIDSQALQVTQHEAVKQFIRQEREAVEEKVRREFGEHSEAIYSHRREALLREVSELIKKKEREIPKAKKGDFDAMLANLNQQHINIGYNQAITEVQEIIKKKI